ncbi:MAG TPA: hypothetical protein VIG48_11050 [Jatrophihabitans sp.]|jgi:hypothetical protein
MTIVETVLVFLGIPLGVVALVVFAVYGRSMVHQPNRYRPGKAWTYPPAWYLPHPQAIDDVVGDRVASGPTTQESTAVSVGGANGEW